MYGAVTQRAIGTVEAAAPARRRAHAMMTTADPCRGGLPSEWSAAIDQLAAGSLQRLDESGAPTGQRLFVLAAGNVQIKDWQDYPDSNLLSPVEDPSQAWNALAVGAFTELTEIDRGKWPSLSPIAMRGGLSPASSTSVLWSGSRWPFKPDVVAEGGNGSTDSKGPVDGPESLRLLTTAHDMTKALLTEAGDTSAAAAQVARLASHISARYPDYQPETIRALIIHGAKYTDAMRAGMTLNPGRNQKENLVRRFGFGAIDFESSLNSSSRRPVMVVEDTLHPYKREGSSCKLNEHNLHTLPWPAEQLAAYGSADVEMRVTLSYFVFPNPSRRGWQSKFRYPSHGLRFAVKGATETPEIFAQRINKIEREKAEDEESASARNDPDRGGWLLGQHLRSRGSVQSDTWSGSAAALAEKSDIAIFPVGGWWKEWTNSEGQDAAVRYSLIVSLRIAETLDVDLYSPIQNELGVPITVEGQL
ncbi:S8 family peptidase [Algiphilus sp.]|uniref:S8 family peptidase n=1 Tax=Algiphilus sp. TaxID=1872431 RepID=UPI003456E27A